MISLLRSDAYRLDKTWMINLVAYQTSLTVADKFMHSYGNPLKPWCWLLFSSSSITWKTNALLSWRGPTLFKWLVTSSKVAAPSSMKPTCSFINMKAASWRSILLWHMRQKAKPKHDVTPERGEGDTEVADPKHPWAFISRLQALGCQDCQLALANHAMNGACLLVLVIVLQQSSRCFPAL